MLLVRLLFVIAVSLSLTTATYQYRKYLKSPVIVLRQEIRDDKKEVEKLPVSVEPAKNTVKDVNSSERKKEDCAKTSSTSEQDQVKTVILPEGPASHSLYTVKLLPIGKSEEKDKSDEKDRPSTGTAVGTYGLLALPNFHLSLGGSGGLNGAGGGLSGGLLFGSGAHNAVASGGIHVKPTHHGEGHGTGVHGGGSGGHVGGLGSSGAHGVHGVSTHHAGAGIHEHPIHVVEEVHGGGGIHQGGIIGTTGTHGGGLVGSGGIHGGGGAGVYETNLHGGVGSHESGIIGTGGVYGGGIHSSGGIHGGGIHGGLGVQGGGIHGGSEVYGGGIHSSGGIHGGGIHGGVGVHEGGIHGGSGVYGGGIQSYGGIHQGGIHGGGGVYENNIHGGVHESGILGEGVYGGSIHSSGGIHGGGTHGGVGVHEGGSLGTGGGYGGSIHSSGGIHGGGIHGGVGVHEGGSLGTGGGYGGSIYSSGGIHGVGLVGSGGIHGGGVVRPPGYLAPVYGQPAYYDVEGTSTHGQPAYQGGGIGSVLGNLVGGLRPTGSHQKPVHHVPAGGGNYVEGYSHYPYHRYGASEQYSSPWEYPLFTAHSHPNRVVFIAALPTFHTSLGLGSNFQETGHGGQSHTPWLVPQPQTPIHHQGHKPGGVRQPEQTAAAQPENTQEAVAQTTTEVKGEAAQSDVTKDTTVTETASAGASLETDKPEAVEEQKEEEKKRSARALLGVNVLEPIKDLSPLPAQHVANSVSSAKCSSCGVVTSDKESREDDRDHVESAEDESAEEVRKLNATPESTESASFESDPKLTQDANLHTSVDKLTSQLTTDNQHI